jgi:integrase
VGSDAAFLSLSENERRAFREPKLKTFPTLEQVSAAIDAMPHSTEIEMRDRFALVLGILSGARDGAMISLRLKHVDLPRRLIMQDPREVRTKRRKRIDTFIFPLSPALESIFDDWVSFLRGVKLFGDDAPLLPRARVAQGEGGSFTADGLEPIPWENTQALCRIYRDAFVSIGLPYFKPHSFRDTLGQFGERHAPSIEHYKAWSQNLGHEHISTTLTAYGNMDPYRQGELVRSMAGVADRDQDSEANRAMFEQFMRLVKAGRGGGDK